MSVTVSIDVRNVSKILGSGTEQQVTALNDVSVSIAQNEFFTLLGPSGCGTTTLLRLIAEQVNQAVIRPAQRGPPLGRNSFHPRAGRQRDPLTARSLRLLR